MFGFKNNFYIPTPLNPVGGSRQQVMIHLCSYIVIEAKKCLLNKYRFCLFSSFIDDQFVS